MKTDVDSIRAQVQGCVSTHAYLIELQGNIKDKHGETSPVRDTRNNYHPILKSLKREMHAPKKTKCR